MLKDGVAALSWAYACIVLVCACQTIATFHQTGLPFLRQWSHLQEKPCNDCWQVRLEVGWDSFNWFYMSSHQEHTLWQKLPQFCFLCSFTARDRPVLLANCSISFKSLSLVSYSSQNAKFCLEGLSFPIRLQDSGCYAGPNPCSLQVIFVHIFPYSSCELEFLSEFVSGWEPSIAYLPNFQEAWLLTFAIPHTCSEQIQAFIPSKSTPGRDKKNFKK